MTTSGKPKTNPQLISSLHSKDSVIVLDTIKQLRDSGNISYLPELFELMSLTKIPEIKSSIVSLLSDLKVKDAIPLLIEAIENKSLTGIQKDLVAICWENSMDFSPYLPLFINLVVKSDFETSFEAYTVIINLTGVLPEEEINAQIDRIESFLQQVSPEKKQLLVDIIDFLPSISS